MNAAEHARPATNGRERAGERGHEIAKGRFDADPVISRLLQAVREELRMDTAFIGRVTAGRRIICSVAGDGVSVGTTDPAEQTYCQLILDGEVPRIIGRTADVPAVRRLPATARLGIESHIGVPLHLSDGSLFGTLCAYSGVPRPDLDDGDLRILRLVADLLTARLERHVDKERSGDEQVARLHSLIDSGQPDVAFQPIVDLRTRTTVGFEALARFTVRPQRPPDAWFAEAATVGLGIELELAAIANALAAAAPLPAHCYVSVNVSPSTACDDRLRQVLRGAGGRDVVVEVTEHDHGGDDLQASLELLRDDGHRTAVDDAGAGYAGWTRILQLHPEVIKLDRGIVSGVDSDVARQAMITAAVNFVAASGAELVAEGVETEAEAATLAALGVTTVQGFLTGRPAPAPRA